MRYLLTTCLCLLMASSARGDDDAVKPVEVVALERKQPVLFDKDIRPILVKKCYVCHSGGVTEGDLDLSSYKSLLTGGGRGTAVKPGKAADSLLVKAAGRTAEPLMPPPDENDAQPLSPQELALIKLWINQGAKPPAGAAPAVTLKRLSSAVQMVRAIAVAPDKSTVAVGRANQIHVYAADTGAYVRTLNDSKLVAADGKPAEAAHLSIVESLAFSPDSRMLASGGFQDVALWDAATGQLQRRLTGFAHRVVSLDFSPDGRYLATSGGAPTVAGEVRVFDVDSGRAVLEIADAHSDTAFGVRFSPEGGRLATCGADMSIKIFEFPAGKLIKKLEGHTHHVLDVAWQADGAILASAGADKKVRLWDYQTGEQLTKINRGGGAINTIFLNHDNQVSRLTFVGDSAQVLTCSGNRPVQLWRLTKQMRPGNYAKPYIQGSTVRSFGDGTDYVYAIGISPDASVVATGGRAGIAWLYNGADGKPISPLVPPGVEVPAVSAAAKE